MINLNKELLNINKYPSGLTRNIEIKLGRKYFLLDINKNAIYTNIDFYHKANKSKYGDKNNVLGLRIKSDAILNRSFFENIAEIKRAQNIVDRFKQILD